VFPVGKTGQHRKSLVLASYKLSSHNNDHGQVKEFDEDSQQLKPQ
jgi:hypothetical protein